MTGDESWVQYFASKSRPSKDWRQSSPPDVKIFKTSPPPGKSLEYYAYKVEEN